MTGNNELRESIIGKHIQTTEEYKKKMYEALYHEEILDGVVIDIDENNVVTS